MALVSHHLVRNTFGQQFILDLLLDGDTAYPTGGYSLSPVVGSYFAGRIHFVQILPTAANQWYVWDFTNQKVIFTDGAGNEAGSGTDQSARKNIHARFYISQA